MFLEGSLTLLRRQRICRIAALSGTRRHAGSPRQGGGHWFEPSIAHSTNPLERRVHSCLGRVSPGRRGGARPSFVRHPPLRPLALNWDGCRVFRPAGRRRCWEKPALAWAVCRCASAPTDRAPTVDRQAGETPGTATRRPVMGAANDSDRYVRPEQASRRLGRGEGGPQARGRAPSGKRWTEHVRSCATRVVANSESRTRAAGPSIPTPCGARSTASRRPATGSEATL